MTNGTHSIHLNHFSVCLKLCINDNNAWIALLSNIISSNILRHSSDSWKSIWLTKFGKCSTRCKINCFCFDLKNQQQNIERWSVDNLFEFISLKIHFCRLNPNTNALRKGEEKKKRKQNSFANRLNQLTIQIHNCSYQNNNNDNNQMMKIKEMKMIYRHLV